MKGRNWLAFPTRCFLHRAWGDLLYDFGPLNDFPHETTALIRYTRENAYGLSPLFSRRLNVKPSRRVPAHAGIRTVNSTNRKASLKGLAESQQSNHRAGSTRWQRGSYPFLSLPVKQTSCWQSQRKSFG